MKKLFLGIDGGTQGVRAIAADEDGVIIARKSVAIAGINVSRLPGRSEQNPAEWEEALERALQDVVGQLTAAGRKASEIAAIAVDATCSTLVPIDRSGRPLMNAIMYNDLRAETYVDDVLKLSDDYEKRLGIRQNAVLGPARYAWFSKEASSIGDKLWKVVSHADYLVGLLSGQFAVSDYSCALKAGYDILEDCWPAWLESLGFDRDKLPKAVPVGTGFTAVSSWAAGKYGLAAGTPIFAGSTDAYASAIAAGVVRPGDWASVLGTTLVLKGVTDRLRVDPSGATVTHKFPGGCWLASGASNVGGICLNDAFPAKDFDEMNPFVMEAVPTGIVRYPLVGTGERYPFINPRAKGFVVGDDRDPIKKYASLMEGVAFTERLGLEHQQQIGNPVGSCILAAGGACRSEEWLTIRASVLNREIGVPACPEAAYGMAVLAAASHFGSFAEASAAMVRREKTIAPVRTLTEKYEELYRSFCTYCMNLDMIAKSSSLSMGFAM